MLATAAKLSRAFAATFGVLLSGLALEVRPRSIASGYSLPAPGSGWKRGERVLADRIGCPRTKGPDSIRGLFLFTVTFSCCRIVLFCAVISVNSRGMHFF
jgi:hypothetical protein